MFSGSEMPKNSFQLPIVMKLELFEVGRWRQKRFILTKNLDVTLNNLYGEILKITYPPTSKSSNFMIIGSWKEFLGILEPENIYILAKRKLLGVFRALLKLSVTKNYFFHHTCYTFGGVVSEFEP